MKKQKKELEKPEETKKPEKVVSELKKPVESKKKPGIKRIWVLVDAKGEVLGRLACKVAKILIGKNKPIWAPHIDAGDFVVVVNAKDIRVTGKKVTDKKYYKHSGYPKGLRVADFATMMEKSPETVFMLAVKGMLPHSNLGRQMLRKLKIYSGSDHPHKAQFASNTAQTK